MLPPQETIKYPECPDGHGEMVRAMAQRTHRYFVCKTCRATAGDSPDRVEKLHLALEDVCQQAMELDLDIRSGRNMLLVERKADALMRRVRAARKLLQDPYVYKPRSQMVALCPVCQHGVARHFGPPPIIYECDHCGARTTPADQESEVMSEDHEHEWAFIREGQYGKMGRVCGICGHVEMRPERWGEAAPRPTRHKRPYLRVTANGEVTVYPLPLVDVAIDAATIAIMDCVSFGEDVTLVVERVSLWDDEAAEHLVSTSPEWTPDRD